MDAVIFDFDGVIVDSEPTHHAALEAVLRPYDIHLPIGEYIGRSDRDAFVIAFAAAGRQLDEALLDDLIAGKSRRIMAAFETGAIPAYPATVSLIHAALERAPVGVCSAARAPEVHAALASLGLAPRISAVVTAEDVTAAKPHPEGYLLTCRRLGLDPKRCVAVEDSDHGVAAAKAAGLAVVAVAHSIPVQRLAAAHLVVNSTADLTIDTLMSLRPD